MIVKKPYAFLIKKFRLIHAILFALLLYTTINTFNVFSFFNEYAKNKYVNFLNINYITIYTFIACVFIILVSSLIYYLLGIKNKPRKMYLWISVNYIIVFIYFIVMLVFMNQLESTTFDNEMVRIIRDVGILMLIFQFIFTTIIFSRALGFNLKEFDFRKDLEDIKLDATDSEEVEVALGNDGYKYKRSIRKTLRYLRYFIFENKFLVIIISSIIMLTLSLTIILKLKIYNEHYNQNQEFIANSVWYSISESYLTDKDVYGNVINKDNYYLLIKINLKNRLNREIKIDRNTFRLKVNNERLIPKFTMSDLFVDIGETFKELTLEPGKEKSVVLVFEVNKDDYKNEYLLRVKNAENISFGELKSEYADISIIPVELLETSIIDNYNIPIQIDFKDSFLENVKLNFLSYDIDKSFREYYENCYNSVCTDYSYIVKPSGKGNAVLRIKSSLIKENSNLSTYIQYPKDLYKYFGTIRYRHEGTVRELKMNVISSNYNVNEYTYIEVPERLLEANKIELILNVRGAKYNLLLK